MNVTNVAHFRTPFLNLSETFIYSMVKNFMPPIHPIVFTSTRANEQLFPLVDVVNSTFRKYSLPWFINGVTNRLAGTSTTYFTRQLKKRRVQLLHAHFGPQGWELLQVKRKTKLPLITTFYGYDLSRLSMLPLWRERYAQLFKEGDLFLVEGPFMKEALIAIGCPEEKVRIQHIGVELSKLPYRERAPKDNVVFLFCGRFVEKKGLLYALQAFRELRKEGSLSFEFRIIGDGDLMPPVKTFIEENKLRKNVVLLGIKSHSEFIDECNKADVFVAPSVTASSGDTEGGAPTTILEAQACGLPVVATLHADIPHIVLPGKSALLSMERDVVALKRNLNIFIEKPEMWRDFGKAGRAHVERNHNLASELKKLESIYLETLERAE